MYVHMIRISKVITQSFYFRVVIGWEINILTCERVKIYFLKLETFTIKYYVVLNGVQSTM